MTHYSPPDFVQALIIFAGTIFSLEMAQIIGTYIAIIFAAAVGAFASWFSATSRTTSVVGAAWYVCLRIALAVMITVPLAKIIGKYAPEMVPEYTLMPLAIAIGVIGDYESVRNFVKARITSVIDRFTGHKDAAN